MGLVSMLVSVMMLTVFAGIGPDAKKATAFGRAALCESIGLNSSILFRRGDISGIEGILKSLVERNVDLLSAGIRQTDGTMRFEVGDHTEHWNVKTGYSTETHVQVPLRNAESLWGTVELRFVPIQKLGWQGTIQSPWFQYTTLVSCLSFFAFYFYLGKVLKQLDPSNAIPKRVRAALDTLAEGLLVTDKKGRVVLANEAFARWTGKDSEKLIGHDADKFPWLTKMSEEADTRFPWTRAIEDATAQPQIYLQLTDKDNRILTLVANSSPVLGQDGKYRGVLTSFEDITELQQHKVELSLAKDVADAANRAKSEFLARMSHEIRTPMNAILGFAEILQRGMAKDENQRQEYLQTIKNSGEHLLTLINDILDLSKIESGKIDLELARYSPQEIIGQALSIFQIKAREKGLTLSYEATTWLPETILTDIVRLRQIIINLVGNAIKFTENGSVKVVSRMVEGDQLMLAIDIVDTGIGVSAEGLHRIFDPFSQEDTSITRRFGGTGLGLSICRYLAEEMGGSVSATSVQGSGSVFTVTVDPGSIEGVRQVAPNDIQTAKLLVAPDQKNIRLPACNILVVDDGAANRKLVTAYLERAGARVICAENGQVALRKFAENRISLILMDVHMPVMDGLVTTRQLRADGVKIPIIALTGNVMQDDENACRDAGYSGFLAKPIGMQKLLSTVADALGAESFSDTDETNALVGLHRSIEEIASIPASSAPIYSELPTDDEEIGEIVQDFVLHLRKRFILIEDTFAMGDYKELGELAHWLKGAAGSLGFAAFTAPSRELEDAAHRQDTMSAAKHLRTISKLVNRVRGPHESKSELSAQS